MAWLHSLQALYYLYWLLLTTWSTHGCSQWSPSSLSSIWNLAQKISRKVKIFLYELSHGRINAHRQYAKEILKWICYRYDASWANRSWIMPSSTVNLLIRLGTTWSLHSGGKQSLQNPYWAFWNFNLMATPTLSKRQKGLCAPTHLIVPFGIFGWKETIKLLMTKKPM